MRHHLQRDVHGRRAPPQSASQRDRASTNWCASDHHREATTPTRGPDALRHADAAPCPRAGRAHHQPGAFVNSSGTRAYQAGTAQPTVGRRLNGDDHFRTFGSAGGGRYFTPANHPQRCAGDPIRRSHPRVVVTRPWPNGCSRPGTLGSDHVWGDKPAAHRRRREPDPARQHGRPKAASTRWSAGASQYDRGGKYIVRTAPERRQEILESASKALSARPKRIIIEDNTRPSRAGDAPTAPRSMVWLLGSVCVRC